MQLAEVDELIAANKQFSMMAYPNRTHAIREGRVLLTGNHDDFEVLREVDWVIEVVVERLDVKQAIHKRIAETAS